MVRPSRFDAELLLELRLFQRCTEADFVNSGDYYNNYGNVNTLQATITATTVTSTRAGTTETESY